MRIRAKEILFNEKGDLYYDPQRPEAMADVYLTRLPEEHPPAIIAAIAATANNP